MLKRILPLFLILLSFAASAQKPGYTVVNSRYEWLGGMFKALNIPAGSDTATATQVGQWKYGAAVFADTLAPGIGLYIRIGNAWQQVKGGTGSGGGKPYAGYGLTQLNDSTLSLDTGYLRSFFPPQTIVGEGTITVTQSTGGDTIKIGGGGGGGTASDYATLAAMRAASAPVTGAIVRTMGWGAAGDGGAADYIWNSSSTAADDSGGTIKLAAVTTGRYFLQLADGRKVNALQFGVKGDNSTDNYWRIQAVFNYANVVKKTAFFPKGDYKYSQMPMISSWNGTAFSGYTSFALEGEGGQLENSNNNTTFYPTYLDKPALGLQNIRGATIRNIRFIGGNVQALGGGTTALLNNANFIGGGVRDMRYSPSAGIAIDFAATAVPPDGGYPGLTAYYVASAASSARITIEQCYIGNFTCGIVLSPGQTTSVLSSELTFRDVVILHCKTGFSSTNDQNRNLLWYGGGIGDCLYAFDAATYGAQNGNIPHIWGGNYGGKFLFNAKGTTGEAVVKGHGMHAERLGSLGFIGTAASSGTGPAIFEDCRFNFGYNGGYADFNVIAYAPIEFHSVTFTYAAASPQQLFGLPFKYYLGSGSHLDFYNCAFPSSAGQLNIGNLTGSRLNFYGSTVQEGGHSQGASGVGELSASLKYPTQSALNKYTMVDGQELTFADEASARYIVNASVKTVLLGTSIAVTVPGNGTATFTATDTTLIKRGDQVICETQVFYEDAAGGTTLGSNTNSIGVISDISSSSVVTVTGTPQSLVAGNYRLRSMWYSRYHQASTADLVSGTNTLSNVSVPGAWAVGNHIQGTGITQGSWITAIAGSTFTLSKNASATSTGVSVFDADVKTINTAPKGLLETTQVDNLADSVKFRALSLFATPTSINRYGDSFTDGQDNASPSDSGYSSRLAVYYGLTSTNRAFSGRGTWAAVQAHNADIAPASSKLTTVQAGFNDARRGGSNRKMLNQFINAHKAIWINQFLATFSDANLAAKSGSWSTYAASTVGGKSAGAYTQVVNDSIVYSFTGYTNVVASFIGGDSTNQAFARFTYVLYSPSGVFATGTGGTNQQWSGISDGTDNNQRGPVPFLWTGLNAATAYKLKIISNQSTNTLAVDYFGHLKQTGSSYPMLWFKPAYMNATGYAIAPANATTPIMDLYAAAIDSLVAAMPTGYPLFVAQTNAFYNLTTGVSGDNIHPNNTGHRQIFNAGVAVLPKLSITPTEGTIFRSSAHIYGVINGVAAQLDGASGSSSLGRGLSDSLGYTTNDLVTGKSGGQNVVFGVNSGDEGGIYANPSLNGKIKFNGSLYDETNKRLFLGDQTGDLATLAIKGNAGVLSQGGVIVNLVASQTGHPFMVKNSSAVNIFQIGYGGALHVGGAVTAYPFAGFHAQYSGGISYLDSYNGTTFYPMSVRSLTINFTALATGGADQLLKVNSAGDVGLAGAMPTVATSSEINGATDNVKYVTAAGLAASMYVSAQKNAASVTTAGATNVYTATIPGVTAYTTGQVFYVMFHVGNTGSTTININSLGAKQIGTLTATPLVSGDIVTNQAHAIMYTGTIFQMLTIDATKLKLSGGTMTGALAMGSNTITTSGKVTTGGLAPAYSAKVAAYTTTSSDFTIAADATTAAFNVTLVTAVGNQGLKQIIKRNNSGANAVTVVGTSSQTIDGSASFVLGQQYAWVEVTSNNANWIVTGRGGVASYSGTYSPTFTAGTNVTAATISGVRYNVSGKMVTVYMRVTPTLTATSLFSSFEVSLPVAFTVGTANDVGGSGTYHAAGSLTMTGVDVQGKVTTNTGLVSFYTGVSNTSPTISISFSYLLP